jgi:hypothetical protein
MVGGGVRGEVLLFMLGFLFVFFVVAGSFVFFSFCLFFFFLFFFVVFVIFFFFFRFCVVLRVSPPRTDLTQHSQASSDFCQDISTSAVDLDDAMRRPHALFFYYIGWCVESYSLMSTPRRPPVRLAPDSRASDRLTSSDSRLASFGKKIPSRNRPSRKDKHQ